ncbi:MAG: PEP-CTERM sorting domain-containing protein [Limisphaerales bacterium]
MKLKLILSTLFLTSWLVRGQSTFIYDQQSTQIVEGTARWNEQPMGQSFTPSLSSINFVELRLIDTDGFNHAGSTLSVNVRANSITGLTLGSSGPIFTPDGFFGTNTFLFSIPVALTPGITYYLQTVQAGDHVSSYVTAGYAGGSGISKGVASRDYDLWFREGVLVPEPSSGFLFLLGASLFACSRRARK